jgi:hypothetical protein
VTTFMAFTSDQAESLHDFMQEWWKNTVPNPFNNREQIWGDNSVVIALWPFDKAAIRISSMRSLKRGQGKASLALDWLCDMADKHKVTLRGTVVVFDKTGLTKRQLKAWYKRHGFTVKGDNIERKPR